MSFSGEVKRELAEHIDSSRHCQIAEIAAIFCCNGRIECREEGGTALSIQTENEQVIRKCFTLLKKSFNIGAYIVRKGSYSLTIQEEDQVKRLLQMLKLSEPLGGTVQRTDIVNPLLIKNACCKRAFLRGFILPAVL